MLLATQKSEGCIFPRLASLSAIVTVLDLSEMSLIPQVATEKWGVNRQGSRGPHLRIDPEKGGIRT
ncbi:hypothetical protein PISMIDRAFT_688546 [Pisolithus microcarpus 441]|uniref:Uncharacterized protein n=1 Tax=Pisolithus microcarpus 441 TaxID=765257 RepID=A0A0C9YTH5_9AGAM|nr:hypothetical protein PISMIDRAFT_688546 [Pisolithus microcarpus 441]